MQQLVLSFYPCAIIKGSRDTEHAGVITCFRSRLIIHLHMVDMLDLGFENNGMLLEVTVNQKHQTRFGLHAFPYFIFRFVGT